MFNLTSKSGDNMLMSPGKMEGHVGDENPVIVLPFVNQCMRQSILVPFRSASLPRSFSAGPELAFPLSQLGILDKGTRIFGKVPAAQDSCEIFMAPQWRFQFHYKSPSSQEHPRTFVDPATNSLPRQIPSPRINHIDKRGCGLHSEWLASSPL